MTGKQLKTLLKTAGTTINKLDRDLGMKTWSELSDAERAAWIGWQLHRIATGDKSFGAGRLVRCGDGTPLAWFDIDTRIHGRCKYPIWEG